MARRMLAAALLLPAALAQLPGVPTEEYGVQKNTQHDETGDCATPDELLEKMLEITRRQNVKYTDQVELWQKLEDQLPKNEDGTPSMLPIGAEWSYTPAVSLTVKKELMDKISTKEDSPSFVTLSDCRIDESEIAGNPDAEALARMMAGSVCVQMGCSDPNSIKIKYFDVPGCDTDLAQQLASRTSRIQGVIGRRLEVDTAYLSRTMDAEALADGILSSAEIATSANATVLANALRDSTCRRLGLSDTQCAHLVEIDGLATAAGKGGTSTVEPTYSIKDRVLINVEYERVNPSA